MQDAAALAHAGPRDDDARRLVIVEALGLVRRRDVTQPLEAERHAVLALEGAARLAVEQLRMTREHRGGLTRHGAVHEDREVGNPPVSHELMKGRDDLLRATDGERRHHHAPAPPHRTLDGLRQRLVALLALRMLAVP